MHFPPLSLNRSYHTRDVMHVPAAFEEDVAAVLPDLGPQLDAVGVLGETPLAAGVPVAVVRLQHLDRRAHDGHVREAGVDLALGGHVDERREVDEGHRGEHGHGHAQAERAADDTFRVLHGAAVEAKAAILVAK